MSLEDNTELTSEIVLAELDNLEVAVKQVWEGFKKPLTGAEVTQIANQFCDEKNRREIKQRIHSEACEENRSTLERFSDVDLTGGPFKPLFDNVKRFLLVEKVNTSNAIKSACERINATHDADKKVEFARDVYRIDNLQRHIYDLTNITHGDGDYADRLTDLKLDFSAFRPSGEEEGDYLTDYDLLGTADKFLDKLLERGDCSHIRMRDVVWYAPRIKALFDVFKLITCHFEDVE